MNRVRSGQRGFTLIELVVVIAAIAILATIAVIGFSRFQADTRDARRASSATVISEALEKYYDKNGEYPSCEAMTEALSTLTTMTLPGVSTSVFTVPDDASGTNSLKCETLTFDSDTDFFQYLGDGSANCQTTACLYYAIRYKDEGTGTIKEVVSRRSPSVDAPTIAAIANSTTQVTVSWEAVANVTGYVIQRSTSSDFPATAATVRYPSSGSQTELTKVFTDEAPGVTHYYRVEALRGTDESRWSNIVSVTPAPTAPSGLAVTNLSSTSQRLTFTASPNAETYRVRRALDAAFTIEAVTLTNSLTTTSYDVSSLNQGIRYYYRVYSVAGGVNSDSPATDDEATTINAPASYTVTGSNNGTTLTATSNAVCPSGTAGFYTWTANGAAWQSGSDKKVVTYTPSINGSVTLAVTTYCFTAEASSSAVAGSNSVSFTRPVPTPSFTVFQASGSRVWAQWTNVCGGTYQLYLTQGGYTEYDDPRWNAAGNPWAGGTTMPSSNNDTRSWASNGNRRYQVRANCGGHWSSWSGQIGPI